MHELFHPVQLNKTLIPGNIFLAPLAGYTDRAFRDLSAAFGADLTFTEMVSCEGILRENKKTIKLLEPAENESLFGIQIFTSNPEKAKESLEILLPLKPAVIDLNCGCPVPKVIKTGAGSALMRSPEKIQQIIHALSTNTDIPITVKIRLGWDRDSINFLDTADAAVQGGAAAVSMHARTRSQGYSGTADISAIKILKEHSPVPVLGSGDLFTPEAVQRMLRETGCDGVLIARGAMGNPFIFQQTKALLTEGKTPAPPTSREKTAAALEHIRKCVHYFGEEICCKEMKKHLCAYTKGLPGGARLRNSLVHAESVSQFKDFLDDYLKSL